MGLGINYMDTWCLAESIKKTIIDNSGMAKSLEEIGTELENVMRFYEKVVSETRDNVHEVQRAAFSDIKDYEAVLGLYAQLRDASDCHHKLYLLTLKYLEQTKSAQNSN